MSKMKERIEELQMVLLSKMLNARQADTVLTYATAFEILNQQKNKI